MDRFEKALDDIRDALPTSGSLDDLINETAAFHGIKSSALRNRIQRKWGDFQKYNDHFTYRSRGIFDIDSLEPDVRYARLINELIENGHDFYCLDTSKWNARQIAIYKHLLSFWKIKESEMKGLSEPSDEPWWREWKESYFEFRKQYLGGPS